MAPWIVFGALHFVAQTTCWIFMFWRPWRPNVSFMIRYVPPPIEGVIDFWSSVLGWPVVTSLLEQIWNGTPDWFVAIAEFHLVVALIALVGLCALNSLVWLVAARMFLRIAVRGIHRIRNCPARQMRVRVAIVAWLSFAVSLFALARTFAVFPFAHVEDVNVDALLAASMNDYLKDCLVEVAPDTNGVRFVFANRTSRITSIAHPDRPPPEEYHSAWSEGYTLRIGEYFVCRPGDRVTSRYTLRTTNTSGVTMHYLTELDLHPFGKKEVRCYSGTVRIPWKEQLANKSSEATP